MNERNELEQWLGQRIDRLAEITEAQRCFMEARRGEIARMHQETTQMLAKLRELLQNYGR